MRTCTGIYDYEIWYGSQLYLTVHFKLWSQPILNRYVSTESYEFYPCPVPRKTFQEFKLDECTCVVCLLQACPFTTPIYRYRYINVWLLTAWRIALPCLLESISNAVRACSATSIHCIDCSWNNGRYDRLNIKFPCKCQLRLRLHTAINRWYLHVIKLWG